MQAGLVSTVITVYNRPALVVEAINSVLAQTHRPIELIVVDDGSTDETGAVLQRMADANPGVVRVVRKEHGGFASAVNAGLRLIDGEFVQFLDSDDLLMPEKFATQIAGLRAHPECGISYCYAREYVLGQQWSGTPARRTGETFRQLFPEILAGRFWPSPVPLYRRDLIDAIGLYQEWSIHREWEYECRAAARGVRLHHAPVFLTDVRGVHHLEGRKKGDVPAHKLPDYVAVLEGVFAHARSASVPSSAYAAFGRRVLTVAQLCDDAGAEQEAHRCRAIAAAIAADRTIGDRAIGAIKNRWRDLFPMLRGKRTLRRYTAHYRKARQVYGSAGNGSAGTLGTPQGLGVCVIPPESSAIALPADYGDLVDRIATSSASAFSDPARCRSFPSDGPAITQELTDPFALDGLGELCDPLLRALEASLYGAYTIADKVYVYRTLVSQARAQKSWLWHFDNHPREVLKLMIYLTDVTDGTAPFEYVSHGKTNRPLYGSPIAPGFGTSRLPQDRVARELRNGCERRSVTGPRGTLILFDDNVVHRATMATTGHRDVLVLQIRPVPFATERHIDPRWTGTFGDRQFHFDPNELAPQRVTGA